MPHPHVITVATRVDEVPTAYQKNIDDPNLDAPNLDDPIAEELTLVVAVRIEERTTSPIFLNNILLEPFNMILCPIIIIIPLILELYQMAIIIKSGLSALYSFLTKDTDSATNNDALNVQQCDYSWSCARHLNKSTVLEGMDNWNQTHHRASGLCQRVQASKVSMAKAE